MEEIENLDIDGFMRDMGIVQREAKDGLVVLELNLESRHMSGANRAHGGVLFTMLDGALGRAVATKLPVEKGCATVEIKINYFRPVQFGTIRVRAQLKEMTKSLGYSEGEITNEEGKVLARASGTFFITETRIQAERERV